MMPAPTESHRAVVIDILRRPDEYPESLRPLAERVCRQWWPNVVPLRRRPVSSFQPEDLPPCA